MNKDKTPTIWDEDVEDALLASEARSEGTCNCCHGADCPTHPDPPVAEKPTIGDMVQEFSRDEIKRIFEAALSQFCYSDLKERVQAVVYAIDAEEHAELIADPNYRPPVFNTEDIPF